MTNSSSWAGTAQAAKYNVHLGTWVNYSRGRIMGATLTLDKTSGNLLIAFTATFVGIVTAALWRIACLLFHRIYSTPEPRDTLHHQRQAGKSPINILKVFTTARRSQLTWTSPTKLIIPRIWPVDVLSTRMDLASQNQGLSCPDATCLNFRRTMPLCIHDGRRVLVINIIFSWKRGAH